MNKPKPKRALTSIANNNNSTTTPCTALPNAICYVARKIFNITNGSSFAIYIYSIESFQYVIMSLNSLRDRTAERAYGAK